MNPERLQMKGLLSDLQRRAKSLSMEASGLIILVRTILSPYQDDVTLLDVEKALVSMGRLQDIIFELREIKAKIGRLEKDLD